MIYNQCNIKWMKKIQNVFEAHKDSNGKTQTPRFGSKEKQKIIKMFIDLIYS